MAKKPTVNTLASGFNSTETLNANFEALRDSFDNTLSLDGSLPNAMEADLDLNGNNLIGAAGLLVNGTDYLAEVTAAKAAALIAQTAAELAETNAETAETNAESSETAAASSATASATSETAAATSESNASASETAAGTSETNASTSATNASTSETNAATSASAASTSATTATTKASEASTSATNAATSETNAATSATNAETSRADAYLLSGIASTNATAAATSAVAASTARTGAETAETNASTSATNASTSETNAGTSETNASTSETNASTSETNASTSESNAATSATTAATKAGEASTSATNAATSETNAGTSETNAATSETNAGTSETNASTSAEASSTSALASATSASNAATSETNAAASASTSTTGATTATAQAVIAANEATAAAASAASIVADEAATAAFAAASAGSAAASANSAASAAAALDNFDDRYLGPKSSEPTVDNDGDTLVSGALYFSTISNAMQVYDGANWIAASAAGVSSLNLYEYTATAGQTTFTGSDDNGNSISFIQGNEIVVFNGIILDPSDYNSTSGTSIVLNVGAALNDLINVYAFKSFTIADTVPATTGGTFGGDVTVTGTLAATTLTGDGSAITGLPAGYTDTDVATYLAGNSPTVGGLTTTANVSFGDNDKAIFGAGSDLQIYHDGANDRSYIVESGASNLYIAGENLRMTNTAGNEFYLLADAGGAVSLRHNNSTKLATTSTGVDVTGNATFADNGKAIFGAGSDLQIYHDGSNSFIDEVGAGNLVLKAGSATYLQNASGVTMGVFGVGNAATLYNSGAAKLATTSTGVDVTGTLTSDGLTVGSASSPTISIEDTDGGFTASSISATNGGRDLTIKSPQEVVIQDADTGNKWLRINEGDISFYDDSNNAKLFWDASAESLSLGAPQSVWSFYSNNAATGKVGFFTDGATADLGITCVSGVSTISPTTGTLAFGTSSTERMRIDSSGNVGIGTNSPSISPLHIRNTDADANVLLQADNNRNSQLLFGDTDDLDVGKIKYNHPSNFMAFTVNTAEAMRIDSSGNLLVGKTGINADTYGTELRSSGVPLVSTSDGATTLNLNRLTSDGTIINLQKGGSTVGSIGVGTGDLLIGKADTQDCFLRFGTGGAAITLCDSDGLNTNDGDVDLGQSNYRFKDAHFSGTVNAGSFAGDGSALTGIEGVPAGVVIYQAASTAPTGFLKANGASLSTTTYADLFAVIGYTFGGSGSSFNVPDLRGEFMRGWDDSRGADINRTFGSFQDHDSRALDRVQYTTASGTGSDVPTTGDYSSPVRTGSGTGYGLKFRLNTRETHPRNIALLACIKY